MLRAYAAQEPKRWRASRHQLVEMTWRTYRYRWRTMYRSRLSTQEWVRAAFQMPFVPAYYRSVTGQLVRTGLSAGKRMLVGGGR